jgi:tyrosine-protein phosphatase SIW14
MQILKRYLLIIAVAAAGFAADIQGIGNFHKVNDQIYRGAQPSLDGIHGLAKLGVHTVIDLRETGERSNLEKKTVESLGMRYVSIPFKGLSAPTADQVSKVLALFNDNNAGPVFVHCRRGADRTGTVVAVYRIMHDGWQNRKALEEAKSMGMSRIEVAMQNYILRFEPTDKFSVTQ